MRPQASRRCHARDLKLGLEIWAAGSDLSWEPSKPFIRVVLAEDRRPMSGAAFPVDPSHYL